MKKKSPGKPRVYNICEKIYFLCFIQPRSKTEVDEILHGPKNRAYSYLSGKAGVFKQLEKSGWLIEDKEFKPVMSKKGRSINAP